MDFTLIEEMMGLGMIIDLGHTPSLALHEIIPVLLANDYPIVHTHGGDQSLIKQLNGMSTYHFQESCQDEKGESGS